ncbi:hypothetical protein NHQ30_001246 [Ciborinia camelliae]|nr:hypothetical protein NHQ30_001246 [Ciborinia camelliae]
MSSTTSKPTDETPRPRPHLATCKTLPTHPATSTEVSIPDGRRNSQGEALHSPIETWKPNLVRNQSWNQQDLKRLHVEEGLKKENWSNDDGVAGLGYTHGGEEEKK